MTPGLSGPWLSEPGCWSSSSSLGWGPAGGFFNSSPGDPGVHSSVKTTGPGSQTCLHVRIAWELFCGVLKKYYYSLNFKIKRTSLFKTVLDLEKYWEGHPGNFSICRNLLPPVINILCLEWCICYSWWTNHDTLSLTKALNFIQVSLVFA